MQLLCFFSVSVKFFHLFESDSRFEIFDSDSIQNHLRFDYDHPYLAPNLQCLLLVTYDDDFDRRNINIHFKMLSSFIIGNRLSNITITETYYCMILFVYTY